MSARVMYIPLDERPCNYTYPEMILGISDVEMVKPPKDLLGYKKQPADLQELTEWMKENINKVNYLVISLDMFVYGGLVPSRLHHKTFESLNDRLNLLRDFKRINSKLKIYAYNLIMRVPSYNSSDEEPDYYAFFGEKIWQLGILTDKMEQRIATLEEKARFVEIKAEIPEPFLEDYLKRRQVNHKINHAALDLVSEGVVDFLIIPMDDCSQYGFSAKERRSILTEIRRRRLLHKVFVYPGADEVGSVLVTKAFNDVKNYEPRIFVRYSSALGPTTIPKVEDRSIHETVKYQVLACGGVIVDSSIDSDFVLLINAPTPNVSKLDEGIASLFGVLEINDPFRNINEFVTAVKYYVEKNVPCAIADTALGSQADEDLMTLLKTNGLLDKIVSYAGWNTSSNTLGTVISHAVVASYFIKNNKWTKDIEERSRRFLFLRYLEDWGYQNHVRPYIITRVLSEFHASYFDLGKMKEVITKIIKEKLYEFRNTNLSQFNYDFEVSSPWNRLYEIEVAFK